LPTNCQESTDVNRPH